MCHYFFFISPLGQAAAVESASYESSVITCQFLGGHVCVFVHCSCASLKITDYMCEHVNGLENAQFNHFNPRLSETPLCSLYYFGIHGGKEFDYIHK